MLRRATRSSNLWRRLLAMHHPSPPSTPLRNSLLLSQHLSNNHVLRRQCFSSTTQVDDYELRKLSRFTRSAVNIETTPLGTMTSDQWQHLVEAMALWFQETKNHSMPVGWTLTHIDKIVERLLWERATGSAASRRQSEQDLVDAAKKLMEAWLAASKEHPKSAIAVTQAQKWWNHLSRHPFDDKEFLSVAFIELVQQWLGLETAASASDAATMLLQADLEAIQINTQSLAHFYDDALRQSIRFCSADHGLELWSRLVSLQHESQTSVGSSSSAAVTRNDNKPSIARSDDFWRRVIEFINKAGPGQRAEVTTWADHWTNQHQPSVMDEEMSLANLAYYIRTEDAAAATEWLSKCSATSEQIEKVFRLWCNLDTHDAPMQADELLFRLEESSKNTRKVLATELYEKVANLWSKSSDSQLRQVKVFDLLHRAPGTTRALLMTAIQCIEDDSVSAYDALATILRRVNDHWGDFGDSDREAIFRSICVTVERNKLSAAAPIILRIFDLHDMALPASQLESLLRAVPVESDADEVVDLLRLAGKSKSKLSFESYRAAIAQILQQNVTPKKKADAMREVLIHVFAKYNVDPGFDSAAVRMLLSDVFDFITSVQLADDATEILRLAEDSLLQTMPTADSYPIPLDCYRNVAILYRINRNYKGIKPIFEKVRKLYQAGHVDLAPDSYFYFLYMLSLGKEGPETVQAQLEMLEEVSELYKSTGDSKFKPISKMFSGILKRFKANPTSDNIRTGIRLLEIISELNVELRGPFPFNTVMHLMLKRGVDGVFRDVQGIMKRIQQHGLQPDSFSLRNILRACRAANEVERDEALAVALQTLHTVRSLDFASPLIYKLLFQALDHLMSLGTSADWQAVFDTVLHLCTIDDCLNDDLTKQPVVRRLLKGVQEKRRTEAA